MVANSVIGFQSVWIRFGSYCYAAVCVIGMQRQQIDASAQSIH